MISALKNISKKKLALIGIAIVFLTIFILYTVSPSRHITTGAWTEGLFDATDQSLHPEKLLELEELVGHKFSIAHYYRGWEALADPNLIAEFELLRSHGWEPMLNVNPYFFQECVHSDATLYKAIARGDCDQFLRTAGKNLSQINQPFYLLFAWEMNNRDLEWSINYSGSTPSEFVSAWQRIHTIFKEEDATNIVWVFSPNTEDSTSVSYSELYPGDDFVDWIGIDGYNWGSTQSWSQWKSFAEVFTPSYEHLVRIAPDKPLMIAEVNTTDQGGNKSAWYTDMFLKQIPYHFPKIQAIIIYNEDRTPSEKVNWKIDITPESLSAFSSGINSKYYR